MSPTLNPRGPLDPPLNCPYPDANVLIYGFHTPIDRIPENAQNVKDRETSYFHTLKPQNLFHSWLADDVAVISLRIERCSRIERRERDQISLRAEFFWDDDRTEEAEEIAARISKDPAKVVARLKRTPQGCSWLIARWEDLAHEARQDRPWTSNHQTLAFDLLGKHADFRNDPITDRIGVATREIDALKARREAVRPADKLEREMAIADLTDQTTVEIRRLRRYEATLHKRLRWNLHQLQIVPKAHRPNSELRFMYGPESVRKPAPEFVPAWVPPPKPAPVVKPPEPTWDSNPTQPGNSTWSRTEFNREMERRREQFQI